MTGQHKQQRQFVRVSVIVFCIPTLLFPSCSTEDARVSPEHKLSKQEIMRLAEDVAAGRREASELTIHGITVGDWIVEYQRGQASLISSFGNRTCFLLRGRIVDSRLRRRPPTPRKLHLRVADVAGPIFGTLLVLSPIEAY